MWNRISELLKRDTKAACHSWYLFIISSTPVVFILLMLFGFPFLADIMLSEKGFDIYTYYSITGMTMASVVPVLEGHFFSYLPAGEFITIIPSAKGVQPDNNKLIFRTRLVSSFILSIIFLLFFNFSTDPVPGEGWIRNCFIAFLFALQAPLVFVFASCYGKKRIKGFIVPSLYLLFVIAVPIGLMMYHPWNYLAFFSPFYWIAWAWFINNPVESIVYGIISVMISMCYFAILCRKKFRKVPGT
jgi:hypothetical protein